MGTDINTGHWPSAEGSLCVPEKIQYVETTSLGLD